ncbi:SDR family NAD(P)-dependent oxidoreductase [Thermodesulfobacteriota bacterium]
MDFQNYRDGWALITGASSGIGAECARQCAIGGLNLVLTARRKDRLKEIRTKLEKEHGVEVRTVAVDLAAQDFLGSICAVTDDIAVDLLINNAGFSLTGDFIDTTCEKTLEMLLVNCRAPLVLTHRFGGDMCRRRKGGIIFISSIAGFGAMPKWSHYAATKAFTLLLGEGLTHEFRRHGVNVLTVCPGSTRTEFHQVAGVNEGKTMDAEEVVAQALKQLGKKSLHIPGLHNLLIASTARFLPRWLNTSKGAFIVEHIQKR